MEPGKVLVHVRFAPNGTVVEISERPKALSPQEWYYLLSDKAGTAYQPLSGGRACSGLRSTRSNRSRPRARRARRDNRDVIIAMSWRRLMRLHRGVHSEIDFRTKPSFAAYRGPLRRPFVLEEERVDGARDFFSPDVPALDAIGEITAGPSLR